MRYNDLQERCKQCSNLSTYSLHMDGNHDCSCRVGVKAIYFWKTDEYDCPFYSKMEEAEERGDS